jgi:four helix bundle protein
MNQGEEKKIRSFTDLEVWKEAHKLAIVMYKISKTFPKEEMFGLTNQMRRATVSVTSNIAEGFSRHSWKDKANFYSIALGSLTETQSQLLLAKDVGYMKKEDFDLIADQTILVSKLCNGLIKKTRSLSDLNS